MLSYKHLLGLQGMVGTKPMSGKRMVLSLTRSRAKCISHSGSLFSWNCSSTWQRDHRVGVWFIKRHTGFGCTKPTILSNWSHFILQGSVVCSGVYFVLMGTATLVRYKIVNVSGICAEPIKTQQSWTALPSSGLNCLYFTLNQLQSSRQKSRGDSQSEALRVGSQTPGERTSKGILDEV